MHRSLNFSLSLRIAFALCIGMPIPASTSNGAEPATADTPDRAAFSIYSTVENAEFRTEWTDLLHERIPELRVTTAETLAQAASADAEVLVLFMPEDSFSNLEPDTLEALKRHKIIGIGYAAAQLFEQMGLEIKAGNASHGAMPPLTLTIPKSGLLGAPAAGSPLPILEARDPTIEIPQFDLFALYLPPRGTDANIVDAVARWTSRPNYAPIARQGNCVLVGVEVSPDSWSPEYTDLVVETCRALHARKLEPFAVAKRTLTKPGKYRFKLAETGSTKDPNESTYYFQFKEPCRLTARLETKGPGPVMLRFTGQDPDRTHSSRKDATNNGTLDLTIDITKDEIAKLRDKYWVLRVANINRETSAECRLSISFGKIP